MYETTKDILIPVASILLSIAAAYLTAVYAIRRESRHGQLLTLELVRRFFLNVMNAVDHKGNLKTQDPKEKKFYVRELEAILEDLGNLIAHPYFSLLIARYPLLSKLIIQTRRELVEHELQSSFALNIGTMAEFWKLYTILRKDLPKVVNSDLDDKIIEIAAKQNLQRQDT